MSNNQPIWADTTATSSSVTEEIHDATIHDGGDFLHQPYSTLDEPIKETIMRDVRSVVSKMKVVLLPLKKTVC